MTPDINLCRNCDRNYYGSDGCHYCALLHERLTERLLADDAPSWMVIAALAIHGPQKQLKPVWRIG
jgi:hypothetical protein